MVYEDPKEVSNVPEDAEVVLKVEHLHAGKMVKDVSFELHKERSLVFRTYGSREEQGQARAIFDADKIDNGDIYVHGKKVTIKSSRCSKLRNRLSF